MQLFKIFTNSPIPQVVGAVNGTHIEILKPENDLPTDYFCRKHKYIINTQAVVGGNLMFLDVSTGYPGSIHDARVLRSSHLFEETENHIILNSPHGCFKWKYREAMGPIYQIPG